MELSYPSYPRSPASNTRLQQHAVYGAGRTSATAPGGRMKLTKIKETPPQVHIFNASFLFALIDERLLILPMKSPHLDCSSASAHTPPILNPHHPPPAHPRPPGHHQSSISVSLSHSLPRYQCLQVGGQQKAGQCHPPETIPTHHAHSCTAPSGRLSTVWAA